MVPFPWTVRHHGSMINVLMMWCVSVSVVVRENTDHIHTSCFIMRLCSSFQTPPSFVLYFLNNGEAHGWTSADFILIKE
jgi:hypothetical protein